MKSFVCLFTAVFLLGPCLLAQEPATDVTEPKVELKRPTDFQFSGGSLADLLKAIRNSFGVDLQQIGTVPETMLYSLQVPKMRLKGRVQEVPHAPTTLKTNGIHFSKVLELYNQVSTDGDSGLGRWILRFNEDGEPSLIMLVPPQESDGSGFSVRAFSFPATTTEQVDNLRKVRDLIAIERDRLSRVVEEGRQPGLALADIQGEVNHHLDAGIIVATGGKVFVEMASAIIQAAKEPREFRFKNRGTQAAGKEE